MMSNVEVKRKYKVGDIVGQCEIIGETTSPSGYDAVIAKCNICGEERTILRSNLTRVINNDPDKCTCNLIHKQGIYKKPSPPKDLLPEKELKIVAGKQIGLYNILTAKGDILCIKCTECGTIYENVPRNNFGGWNHNKCNCSSGRKNSKKVTVIRPGEVHEVITSIRELPKKINKVRKDENNKVRTSKSLTNGGFENKIAIKTSLQRDDMYGTISRYGIHGSSLILAGPDIERHLKDIRETFGSKGDLINIVENNMEVLGSQLERYSALDDEWTDSEGNSHSIKSNAVITYGNIANMPPYRIIDADLMGTNKTDGNLVISMLTNQATISDGYKGFIFTLSERGTLGETYDKITQWIQDSIFSIIGIEAKFVGKTIIVPAKDFLYKHRALISIEKFGRAVDVSVYHYSDQKGPMITCCLIYK